MQISSNIEITVVMEFYVKTETGHAKSASISQHRHFRLAMPLQALAAGIHSKLIVYSSFDPLFTCLNNAQSNCCLLCGKSV